MRDLVRAEAGKRAEVSPGVEYAAVRFFRKLTLALPLALRYRRACAKKQPSPWGVPSTFFFQDTRTVLRPPKIKPEIAKRVAETDPDGAAFDAIMPDMLADALTLASSAAAVRHVARTMPEMLTALAELKDLSEARQLLGVLEIPDDETVLVLDPIRSRGVRLRTTGIATVGQFQILLAIQAPAMFPRYTVTPEVLEAALDGMPPGADIPAATIPAQCFRPEVWATLGAIPTGFDGSEYWLWEKDSLNKLPRVNGERVILLGPPAYPRMWEVNKLFLTVQPRLELLQTLSAAEVNTWLGRGTNPTPIRIAA